MNFSEEEFWPAWLSWLNFRITHSVVVAAPGRNGSSSERLETTGQSSSMTIFSLSRRTAGSSWGAISLQNDWSSLEVLGATK